MAAPDGTDQLAAELEAARPEWTVVDRLFPEFRFPAPRPPKRPWRPRGRSRALSFDEAVDGAAATAIDWRTGAGLLPPRDQGLECNTCTAFALCAVLADLQRIRQPGSERVLSPGHLHWCLAGQSCPDGLDLSRAVSLLRASPVAASTPNDYPFNPAACGSAQGIVRVRRSEALYTAADAKRALGAGPILGVMDLYSDFWRAYGGGIYRHRAGPYLNRHTVEIVGYDDAGGYWILKNSRGPGWGEGGYARVAYGECGIFTSGGNGGLRVEP